MQGVSPSLPLRYTTAMAFGTTTQIPIFGSRKALSANSRNKCNRHGAKASLSTDALISHSSFDIASFAKLLYESQQLMCNEISKLDGKETFSTNPWESQTGKGNTRGKLFFYRSTLNTNLTTVAVLQQGKVFEKAGVNVSVVHGILSKTRAEAMTSQGRTVRPGSPYHAAALSFVLHAQSPFLPTLRGDVRVFVSEDTFWGGGGVDLTIFYVDHPRIAGFHRFWKQLKAQCDNYFYIPSRGEYRGVGGLFYDDLPLPKDQLVDFQSEMLRQFLNSYHPIIESQRDKPWTEEEKRWQRIRRGRYLEFNLVNDRGVRFGLTAAHLARQQVNDPSARMRVSRTDSIMISAPPSIEWPFAYSPTPGSDEEETLELLQREPIDWVQIQA